MYWVTDTLERGVEGYWTKELTEEEQHAYFAKNYPGKYKATSSNGEERCCIDWEMVCLKGKKILPGLSKCDWAYLI